MFKSNIHASFQWWLKEKFVKHQKVSKYCENDCLQNVLILFIFLLTAKLLKIVTFRLKFTFLTKKRPKTNLKLS